MTFKQAKDSDIQYHWIQCVCECVLFLSIAAGFGIDYEMNQLPTITRPIWLQENFVMTLATTKAPGTPAAVVMVVVLELIDNIDMPNHRMFSSVDAFDSCIKIYFVWQTDMDDIK